jgi:HSP20 family protein
MLMRTDPFRDLDRLTQQLLGTTARPVALPMDAYRDGETFVVQFDVPGSSLDSIEITVEQNVLTVQAERLPVKGGSVEMIFSERSTGKFSRQVFLGETLDAEHITADYTAGVLTLRIPVSEAAKPRKVEISSQDAPRELAAAAKV